MASSSSSSSPSRSSFTTSVNLGLVFVVLVLFMGCCSAHLSTSFYKKSCLELLRAVKSIVRTAVSKEPRMGASLLRLHFHDCFINGCDGSILLDKTSSFESEKVAGPNNNSVRGYEVIDEIKSRVEQLCPGVVSCADITAIAARDSTVLLGGPRWHVKLGRRDSKTAFFEAANGSILPSPDSSLTQLIEGFKAQGLSTKDMVALSGSHTIGKTRCTVFRRRIYSDSNIDSSFAKKRQASCPSNSGDDNLAPLDFRTPKAFDNKYYKNLLSYKGLLHSDQILFSGDSTDSLVRFYASNPKSFGSDFASVMVKMGNIMPLTGSAGEIRKNCRKPN